jgi:uncharacterized small protein (DUF1192 family)
VRRADGRAKKAAAHGRGVILSHALLTAIGQGALAIDEGHGIVAVLEKKVAILQVDEVQREIAELKAAIQRLQAPGQ